MYLIPVTAFADNYLWLLHDGKRALVVDPGDAERIVAQHALQLESILVTHYHADHSAGVDALREASGARINADLVAYKSRCLRLRDDKQPTQRTSIARKLLVNPFVRTRQAPIMAAARRFNASSHDDNTVFAAIRQ